MYVSVCVFLFVFVSSVMVGTGIQLGLMISATLTFSLVGLLSPSNRGSLVTALILLFVFLGSFAGYFSSLIYKLFRGSEWMQNTIFTALLFPGIVFGIFFVLNFALYWEGSSGAIPFSTFFTLLFLWSCVSVPLVSVYEYCFVCVCVRESVCWFSLVSHCN